MHIDYKYETLANGLRLVLHPRYHTPVVCISMSYHVGAKDENKGKTGFAHLFEHLMFDGSENVPRGAFDRYCELAGGYNNAYTSEDKTNYHMLLPSNQLELGLWLESDRLRGLALTESGLDTQRHVVMEEKRQRVDNQPYGTFDTVMAEMLYSNHPYGHPVIGSMEDIAAATMDDVTSFHRQYYRPGNAALVIAGDIEPDRVFSLVEKYFSDIPQVSSDAPGSSFTLEDIHAGRKVVEDDVPLPAVFAGFRIAPEMEPGFIAMDLCSDILGNGESSRLYRSMVYDSNIASQVSAYVESREFQSMLMIYAVANPGHSAAELEEAIDAEISSLLANSITVPEIEKIRNKVEYSYYQHLQTLTSTADRLGHYALLYDHPEHIHTMLGEYLATSAEDIVETSREVFSEGNSVVVHYIPAG